jgi:hypothetical protein
VEATQQEHRDLGAGDLGVRTVRRRARRAAAGDAGRHQRLDPGEERVAGRSVDEDVPGRIVRDVVPRRGVAAAEPPPNVDCAPSATCGKSDEKVSPATYTAPVVG